jgi:hypothetical protein
VQVHPGLGEQRSRIQIVGKVLDHFAHGIVIRLGRLPAVGSGIGRESQRHGLNVSLLGGRRTSREIDRFLDRIVGLGKALIAGGIVVVRSHGLSHSPVRHSEFGIELGGALE